MAVAKRQRKGKAHENGTKENPKMGMRTSGETNSPPGQPLYIGQAQGEDAAYIKRGAKMSPLSFYMWPGLMPRQCTILSLLNKTEL